MEAIQSMASEVLVNAAVAVIGLLAAYAMYFINQAVSKLKTQTAQIQDTETRKLLEDALADTETLATVTVGAIEQTTAKALREEIHKGITDHKELVALGYKAFDDIKSKVTPEAQRVITKNLGSFDTYLSRLIETKVLELKSTTGQQ